MINLQGSEKSIRPSIVNKEQSIVKPKKTNIQETIKLDEATIKNCIKYPENNYANIFDSSFSVDKIGEIGLGKETNQVYDNISTEERRIAGRFDMTLDEKFNDSVAKYDALVKQINEKYKDDARQMDMEMFSLNNAFMKNNRNIIGMENIFNSIGTINYSSDKSNEIANNFSDSFIKSYKGNESKQELLNKTSNILSSSFPEETTSFENVSYRDLQEIAKVRTSFYEKGTGIDILNSLASNQNISSILRDEYEKLSKADNIYGLTFNPRAY